MVNRDAAYILLLCPTAYAQDETLQEQIQIILSQDGELPEGVENGITMLIEEPSEEPSPTMLEEVTVK